MLILLNMSMMMTLMFLLSNHPMTLGMILLLEVVIISLITGMLTLNFWLSYILFLIMVGGMLILFSYMTSIISNQKFKLSIYMYLSMLMTLLISYYMIINKNLYWMMNHSYMSNTTFFLKKFIYYPQSMIILMMIMYLLITLIATIKIINIKEGPLRKL